jgi:bile acid:Na+ symporter, BASS family
VDHSVLSSVVLPIGLGSIMLILGLSLTPDDFRRVLRTPRAMAIGMGNLLVVAPVLAFAVAELFGLAAGLAVGLVLLGASPGGTMANVLTHLARGETALSVSMTAMSSVVAVISGPFYLGLATNHFGAGELGDVAMLEVVPRVFAITVVQLSLGMWIRSRRPAAVAAVYPRLKRIAVVIFAGIVTGAIVDQHRVVLDNIVAVGAACLALNVAAMTISFGASKLARLDDRQATAIALELGIHNATLAITVGVALSPTLAVPAAVYSAFMFITGIAFARLMYLRNAGAAAERAETGGAGASVTAAPEPAAVPPGQAP